MCSVVLWVLGRVQATGPAGFVLLLQPASLLSWAWPDSRSLRGGEMERASALQWGPPEGRGNPPKNNTAVCQASYSQSCPRLCRHKHACVHTYIHTRMVCDKACDVWCRDSACGNQGRPKKTWHAHDMDTCSCNECWVKCFRSQHVPLNSYRPCKIRVLCTFCSLSLARPAGTSNKTSPLLSHIMNYVTQKEP